MDLFVIKQALLDTLGNDTQFLFLNTRLILRTGVDLARVSAPGPDSPRASDVLRVLAEMGYDLNRSQHVHASAFSPQHDREHEPGRP